MLMEILLFSANGNIAVNSKRNWKYSISAVVLLLHFDGSTGKLIFPTKIQYKNEYDALVTAPAAATYPGYFFTVDGDDNPYVNINITAGGVGDTRAKLLTEYSSIGDLTE